MDQEQARDRLRVLTDEMIAVLVEFYETNSVMAVQATTILQYNGKEVSRMGLLNAVPTPEFVAKLEDEANEAAEGA
jgi:hypothetical protein